MAELRKIVYQIKILIFLLQSKVALVAKKMMWGKFTSPHHWFACGSNVI